MLPVVWLDDASSDLPEIVSLIAEENPVSAYRLHARLESAPLALADNPYLFPAGRTPGTL
jgi:plasmid stabilization system protein ParE